MVRKYIQEIFDDTLKKNGKWSRMSMMMITSWNVVLIMAIVDFFHNGLRLEVWFALLGFSASNKYINAHAERISNKKETTDDTI